MEKVNLDRLTDKTVIVMDQPIRLDGNAGIKPMQDLVSILSLVPLLLVNFQDSANHAMDLIDEFAVVVVP